MTVRKLKNDRFMTHEAVAEQLWIEEGCKGKMVSKQAIAMIEKRILKKFQIELAKFDINKTVALQYLNTLGDQNNYAEVDCV